MLEVPIYKYVIVKYIDYNNILLNNKSKSRRRSVWTNKGHQPNLSIAIMSGE